MIESGDELIDEIQQQEPMRIVNTGTSLNRLVFLADKNELIASDNMTIFGWNVETGEKTREIRAHTNFISSLVVLPGNRVASCSADTSIKIWNMETGSIERVLTGHTKCVNALAALTEPYLASCSNDSTLKIWNYETGHLIAEKITRTWQLRICALPNGDIVTTGNASPSGTFGISVWNAYDGQLKMELAGHDDVIFSLLAVSNEELASGSSGKIRVWNLGDGSLRAQLEHENIIYSLELLSNNSFASCSHEGTIKIWSRSSVNDWHCAKTCKEQHSKCYIKSIVNLNNNQLASCSSDKSIKIWKL